jgi:hypothetical protein
MEPWICDVFLNVLILVDLPEIIYLCHDCHAALEGRDQLGSGAAGAQSGEVGTGSP